jgi:hypothetical protein
MSGNVDAEALPVATTGQYADLFLVGVLLDNNNVPVESLGVNVSALLAELETSLAIIQSSLVTNNTTASTLPNLPVIPGTGGAVGLTGQVYAKRNDTFAVSQWTVNLLVNRTNGASECTTNGDVTPSVFFMDASMSAVALTLSAGGAGPVISVTGLSGVSITWTYNLNAAIL